MYCVCMYVCMYVYVGFPEFWWSWRNQMSYFSPIHTVVAVDMRGFNQRWVGGCVDVRICMYVCMLYVCYVYVCWLALE